MSFRPHVSRVVSRPVVVCSESRTKAADASRTDIRQIVARAMRGKPVTVNVRQGHFADISDAPTLTEALNLVRDAQSRFDSLPSAIRDRFGNDPLKLLDFIHDDANVDEARKLGLVKPEAPPPAPPEPMRVVVVPESSN